jgi:hypothetical protein
VAVSNRMRVMSPRDHNKTLVVLYSLVAGFLALLLCASPWIIAKNVSSTPRRGGTTKL